MTAIVTVLLLDIIALLVILVAIARIVMIPAERWNQGLVSKIAWIAISVAWIESAHSLALPIGALVALWQTHVIGRSKPASLDVPYAQGTPETTETETTGTEEHA